MSGRAQVVVVGAGPAGLACALWCRRVGLDATVFEAGAGGGQLNDLAWPIPDLPGVEVTGPELRARCLEQIRRLDVDVRLGTEVTAVDARARTVWLGDRPVEAEHLVLATGAAPRRLDVPGEAEMLERGEVFRASRDARSLAGVDVVVVGGGDRAVESAVLLDDAGARVALVYRSEHPRARADLRARLARTRAVRHISRADVRRIVGRDRVEAVDVARDGDLERLAAAAVVVCVGLVPNTALVADQVALESDGWIATDSSGGTSAPGVYAVGDVATPTQYSSISTCFGQAMIAAKRIAICGSAPSTIRGHAVKLGGSFLPEGGRA